MQAIAVHFAYAVWTNTVPSIAIWTYSGIEVT